MRHAVCFRWLVLLIISLVCFTAVYAKTRWSALHFIPDADMLAGGKFVIESNNFLFSDVTEGYTVRPSAMLDVGIIEWVNVELGYCGGFNAGLKARILGETKPWLPSLALGIRNAFYHNEAYFFKQSSDTICNEIFMVLGKSIEPIRLRLHLGVQSVPTNPAERFNPFFAAEKYFGSGLYLSAEVYRRSNRFIPTVFMSYRFIKSRVEVTAGIVDIMDMLRDENGTTALSLKSTTAEGFVRPGIFFGLRIQGGLNFMKSDAFTSVEDRLAQQSKNIKMLHAEVDSLRSLIRGSNSRLESLDKSIKGISDSSMNSSGQLTAFVLQKLISLKTLYSQEPFEPEAVKGVIRELAANRERILPALSEIALSRRDDPQVRTYALTVMGEIGSRTAADALIEILGQAQIPEMKIEALIGLGKLKETRAVFLMKQLANDPHDGVAFTAREILQKLEKETGIITIAESPKNNQVQFIAEKKIGTAVNNEVVTGKVGKKNETVPEADSLFSDDSLQKIAAVPKPVVIEQTISAPAVVDSTDSIEWPIDSAPVPKNKEAVSENSRSENKLADSKSAGSKKDATNDTIRDEVSKRQERRKRKKSADGW